MAKKKAAGGLGFNMAEEIRSLLREDPTMTGRAVIDALKRKYPNETIKDSSCSVAYSNARQKLGITGRGGKRKKATGKKKTVRRLTPAATGRVTRSSGLDLSAVEQAQKFVSACGGMKNARAAIDLLETFQVSGN